jgi:predicted membrane chloride channel (bestrophin family)
MSSLALYITTVLGRDQAFQEVFEVIGLLCALTHLLTLLLRKSPLFFQLQHAGWICPFTSALAQH